MRQVRCESCRCALLRHGAGATPRQWPGPCGGHGHVCGQRCAARSWRFVRCWFESRAPGGTTGSNGGLVWAWPGHAGGAVVFWTRVHKRRLWELLGSCCTVAVVVATLARLVLTSLAPGAPFASDRCSSQNRLRAKLPAPHTVLPYTVSARPRPAVLPVHDCRSCQRAAHLIIFWPPEFIPRVASFIIKLWVVKLHCCVCDALLPHEGLCDVCNHQM